MDFMKIHLIIMIGLIYFIKYLLDSYDLNLTKNEFPLLLKGLSHINLNCKVK